MIELTALDGGHVSIESDVSLTSFHGSIGVSDENREYTANTPGLANAMLDMAKASSTMRILEIGVYDVHGGQLTVAHVERHEIRLGREVWLPVDYGVWEGTAYSLMFHGSGMTTREAVGVLQRKQIDETPTGLVLSGPKRKALFWMVRPSVITEVAGVSQFEVLPLSRQTASRMPRWSGSRVRGGDLYVGHMGDGQEDRHYYMLVSKTAVLTAVPVPSSPEQRTVDILSEMLVDWVS